MQSQLIDAIITLCQEGHYVYEDSRDAPQDSQWWKDLPQSLNGARVLLVEDVLANRQVARELGVNLENLFATIHHI